MSSVKPLSSIPQELLDEPGTKVHFKKDDIIFRRGESGDSLFIIESGFVSFRFEGDKQNKILGQGQYFGELCLLTGGGERTATARAHSDCVLKKQDQETMERWRINKPDILCKLLRETCAYLVVSEQDLIFELRQRNRKLETALDFLRRTKEELDITSVQAITDELTGLYNRRCLQAHLDKFTERARENSTDLAMVLIDLDRFKPINDTYGHTAGDEVLQELGKQLKIVVRDTDLPCRLGGDEFAVLIVDTTDKEAEQRALEIYRALDGIEVEVDGIEQPIRISLSMGGAVQPWNRPPANLLKQADECLYMAKGEGRNRFSWMGRMHLGSHAKLNVDS